MDSQLKLNPARRWSHDLRNGMNTLRLCACALEVCDDPKELLELVSDIERAAEKITDLTEHVPHELLHADADVPHRAVRTAAG